MGHVLRLFAAGQAYVIAGALALAAGAKIAGSWQDLSTTGFAELHRMAIGTPTRKALRRLWLGLAIVELALAILLVIPVARRLSAIVAMLFLGAGLAYVVWIRTRRKGLACGCFGNGTPATVRSVIRSAAFVGASTGLVVSRYWSSAGGLVYARQGTLVGAAILGEVGLLLWLSDELRPWLRQFRLWNQGWAAKWGQARMPMSVVAQRIESLDYWAAMHAEDGPLAAPSLKDGWRNGPWYLLEYSDELRSGEPVTLIAAEYLMSHPSWVRVITLQERGAELEVLGAWDSARHSQQMALAATS